ncbi:MAG TPA: peptidoglycan DD-metalloendopeptidase family protein [Burkholderiaceae bacterium]|nr:peptidoglycan DD-metalloendopeptidase family protein [Burkholderiaceae bacterium]
MTSLGSPAQTLIAAQTWLTTHRKAVAGTVLALLAGAGVTAFAVAPMAPDAAALPQRVLAEAVEPDALAPQLEALAAHRIELSRSDVTRAGDTAGALLQRLGVADGAAVTFLRNDPTARRLLEGRGGRSVQARAREDGTLIELVARFSAANAEQVGTHFTRVTITRDAKGWFSATEETAPLQTQVRLASGTIKTSLFAASDAARVPDAIAVQMAEIFAADIDMHRELRRGDTFSVVYEALTADGEPISWNQGTGRVLAAEFVNGGREYHALWFRGPDGRGAYFDLNGQSKKRAFLASPMEFSRVTSGFAMRFHPIHQTWRKHNGVDYAAPTGTPVRAVGAGVVDFAGWQNGYGNVVQIKHSNDRSTVYAHLSRIDVKKGGRVEQGQRIGAVGSTGWSTGPHLHFEFRVNGAHQDPLKIAKASETIALAPSQKVEFQRLAQGLQGQLDVAETLQGARGRTE